MLIAPAMARSAIAAVSASNTGGDENENSHNPSLSPSGDLLAVRVERPESCPDPLYGEILIGKISVVSRSTGEERDLTAFDCDLFYDTPRWIDDSTLVAVRVTKDGTRVFVALGPSNRVAVVDGETWEVLDYLLVGQRVWQLAFTPDEKFLISTNGNSNDVSIIDVEALEVIRSVQVGQQPWGVVVTPE